MRRASKILKEMDKAVDWMNKVKEYGGIEEAEAARIAAGEQSTDQQEVEVDPEVDEETEAADKDRPTFDEIALSGQNN